VLKNQWYVKLYLIISSHGIIAMDSREKKQSISTMSIWKITGTCEIITIEGNKIGLGSLPFL